MANLDSMLKNKDITLPTKVHIVEGMVFSVVMYGLWELDHREGSVLKNYFYFFNWRIIYLHNSVVFCHTLIRISHRYTHVPLFPPKPPAHLPSHPTLLIVTEPLFESSELHSKFPLAIYFTYGLVNFHVTLCLYLKELMLSSCGAGEDSWESLG